MIRSHPDECWQCGKIHTGPRYKFCSDHCAHTYANIKRREMRGRPAPKWATCETCHKTFAAAAHGRHVYCSQTCRPSFVQRKEDWSADYRLRRVKMLAKACKKHGLG